jgi:hypothetical protein
MKTYKLLLLWSICFIFLLWIIISGIKNSFNNSSIDSTEKDIEIRNIQIDSLNNELNKLKGVKFDTTKLKEDIKISDEKINKIKHEKEIDTISYNSIDEYRKFFSVYLQSKK